MHIEIRFQIRIGSKFWHTQSSKYAQIFTSIERLLLAEGGSCQSMFAQASCVKPYCFTSGFIVRSQHTEHGADAALRTAAAPRSLPCHAYRVICAGHTDWFDAGKKSDYIFYSKLERFPNQNSAPKPFETNAKLAACGTAIRHGHIFLS